MPIFVPLSLVSWIVVSIALFLKLAPRRAILVSAIGGWLFLPVTTIPIPGLLPDLDKTTAIVAGCLGGMLVFDRAAFLQFRPRIFDVPMLVWVMSPLMSSLTNGLGLYDGLAAVLGNLLPWGIPYLLGRIYFCDKDGLGDLAQGIFIGGLIYVPLCWIEIISGPRLHFLVYGISTFVTAEALRFGGWRPAVFMENGLMVALWMTTATVCGVVLHLQGGPARWGRWREAAGAILLFGTTVALKSVNAWVELAFVLGLLFVTVHTRRTWLVWSAIALALVYIALRVTGLWDGFSLGMVVHDILPSKSSSLLYRFVNELQIAERARLQPIWGWGRWGRAYVAGIGGLAVLIPDSLWIGAFGQQGTVGLVAILGVLFAPAVLFVRRVSPGRWLSPMFVPVTVCVFVVFVFALDSLANAMLIPVYMLAAGGVMGWGDEIHRDEIHEATDS